MPLATDFNNAGEKPSLFDAPTPIESIADVEKLLDEGSDINGKDSDGNTFLIEAICNDTLHDVAHWLIDNGASLNEKNAKGYTALHFAALNGFMDIAHHLTDKGAKFSLKSDDGDVSTAVEIARQHKHENIAQFLEDAEAERRENNPVLIQQKKLRARAPHPKIKG